MQFRVPQFIDIEDKIIGPLSWRQFAYILGAAAIGYVCLRLLPSKILALIVGGPFILLFLALAFVRINDRPFVETLQNAFSYFTRGNIYTWQKNNTALEENKPQVKNIEQMTAPVKMERKNLKELAFGLDVKTGKEE